MARIPRTLPAMLGAVAALATAAWGVDPPAEKPADPPEAPAAAVAPGTVRCANLVYGSGKTSVCYSPEFLAETARQTNIVTEPSFTPVKLDSEKLYQHPFAVWTGEGSFQLSTGQRESLRQYLSAGGFIVASAGCSSPEWARSFRTEVARTFPEIALEKIDLSHPLFHTVYDIDKVECKRHSAKEPHLEGIEIDGRIVLIFSEDGLNDTAKAGKSCCCCGGNEIKNAREINVNLLAYALTH